MPSLAIVNCDLYTPDERIPQGLIWVEGDRMRAVGSSQQIALPPDAQLIDAQGGRLTPGLIDLCWRDEGSENPIAHGITSHTITLAVRSEEDLAVVAQAATALTRAPTSARPLGLHLRLLDDAPAWDDLWIAADAAIALVTLSANHPRTPDLARRLLAAGVKIVLDGPAHDPFLHDLLICGLAALAREGQAPSARYLFITADEAPHYSPADDRLLLASGPNRPLSGPTLAFPHLLSAATRQPAAFLGLPHGRLAPGAPADLACWTRLGELAWVMVGGRVVFPREETSPPGGAEAKEVDRDLAALVAFLRRQEETIEVQSVAALPDYQAGGVDLVWRFRQKNGRAETVTITVLADASEDNSRLSLDLPPTRADWYFYHFPATHTLYCLPAKATRAWCEQQQAQSSLSDEPRLAPVSKLLAAIPRLKCLDMSDAARQD